MLQTSAQPSRDSYHAVVIGSGPNGLAAAIRLAREGLNVLIVEARNTIGGGTRTAELTLPGFHHDVCSAVHPMAVLSPFLQSLPLAKFGLEWAHPEVLLAHPLENGDAAVMFQNLEQTAAGLGGKDGDAYRRKFGGLQQILPGLLPSLLGPPLRFPTKPFSMARFGLQAMQPASFWTKRLFAGEKARALFAGHAAHSILPLEKPFTAAVGLMLATAGHLVGWPVARGGSQSIANAMGRYFQALGGEIVTGKTINSLADLPKAGAYLFDTTPRAVADICGGGVLPAGYVKQLRRFRYGAGACKMDLALSGPIPWKNEACRKAGTVHVGGDFDAIAHSERVCWQNTIADRPFVLVAQQSVPDASRAPIGKHTCWAYCHVPHGWEGDASDKMISQIEHYAPGFQDLILAKHVMRTADFFEYNANYIGGDIIGGTQDMWQILARPVLHWNPYATPNSKIYLCSSSTPPGGGVHGMCGFHAAESAIRRCGDFSA